jgi:hypothetical protein
MLTLWQQIFSNEATSNDSADDLYTADGGIPPPPLAPQMLLALQSLPPPLPPQVLPPVAGPSGENSSKPSGGVVAAAPGAAEGLSADGDSVAKDDNSQGLADGKLLEGGVDMKGKGAAHQHSPSSDAKGKGKALEPFFCL